MKYYKSVEIFVNFYSVKPPRSNPKPSYWKPSSDGSDCRPTYLYKQEWGHNWCWEL